MILFHKDSHICEQTPFLKIILQFKNNQRKGRKGRRQAGSPEELRRISWSVTDDYLNVTIKSSSSNWWK